MTQTAMQELIEDLTRWQTLEISDIGKNMINIVKAHAEKNLLKERLQIESAYNNAKAYPSPDCDGSKYYFMTYITND
jgi:hypothetical protein